MMLVQQPFCADSPSAEDNEDVCSLVYLRSCAPNAYAADDVPRHLRA